MDNKTILFLLFLTPVLSALAMNEESREKKWTKLFQGFYLNLTPPVEGYMKYRGWKFDKPSGSLFSNSLPSFQKDKLLYVYDKDIIAINFLDGHVLIFDYSKDNQLEVFLILQCGEIKNNELYKQLSEIGFSRTIVSRLLWEGRDEKIYMKIYKTEKGINNECPLLLILDKYGLLPDEFFEIELFKKAK